MKLKQIAADRALLIIILVALATRIALTVHVTPYPERYIYSDGAEYDQIAQNLIAGNGFSKRSSSPYVPNNFRLPGYPVYLASVYLVVGYHPNVVLYAQAFAGALVCSVAYALARYLSSRNTALLTALLVAISPQSVTYSSLLWSDTIYTLVLGIGIILSVAMFSSDKLRWPLLGGLVVGAATLFHPRTLFLPLVICTILVFAGIRTRQLPITAKKATLYLAVFGAALLPWIARNYSVFGIPNLTSAAGINSLFYGAALTESRRTGEPHWSISERYKLEILADEGDGLNEAEFASTAFWRGLELIGRDPASYVMVHLAGAAKVFMPGGLSIERLITGEVPFNPADIYSLLTTSLADNEAMIAALSQFSMATWLFIALDAILMAFMVLMWLVAILLEARHSLLVWVLSAIILYLVIAPGPAGAPRFRVAIVPALASLAAFGAFSVRERLTILGPRHLFAKVKPATGNPQT